MLETDWSLDVQDLRSPLQQLWSVAPPKAIRLAEEFPDAHATPVLTIGGKYVSQGWTEWTRGFQYGIALLAFDATGDPDCLRVGRARIRAEMPPHITHVGVHDHGFNIVSTYGNLLRMAAEGLYQASDDERELYALALRCSGAVQAARWSPAVDTGGYIYSFNGPHSLFCDTIRSLRALALAAQLGHWLWSENDRRVDLIERLVQHARTTARYNVYYGEQRDIYDQWGRVAHESLFNVTTGEYRCPSTQQGYSPFTTWTRGLAWVMLGYPEQLEFLSHLPAQRLAGCGGFATVEAFLLQAARASCDFYLTQACTDGLVYWDTGAPGLQALEGWHQREADPYNDYEPVDSSAAAIGCQGLLRLGDYLMQRGDQEEGRKYWQAGLTVLGRLLGPPYFSKDADHDGLLLHSVYHRPRGWDGVAAGSVVPHSESSLWGDYHLLEAALYVQRRIDNRPTYRFFNGI